MGRSRGWCWWWFLALVQSTVLASGDVRRGPVALRHRCVGLRLGQGAFLPPAPASVSSGMVSRSCPSPARGASSCKRGLVIRGGFQTSELLARVTTAIDALGPAAPLGFACAYIGCEMVSMPPAPLAVSAGAIYGLWLGTALVLISGIISAALSFRVGRSLRPRFKRFAEDNESFKFLDRVITKGGFKAILLLRLIPTPVPGINYLYGVTSINFWRYVAATAVGYIPSAFALVYCGVLGRGMFEGGLHQPWYVYAGGSLLVGLVAKLGMDMVRSVLREIEAEKSPAA